MSAITKTVLIFIGLGVVFFVLTRLGVFSGKRPEGLGVRAGMLLACPDSPNCVSTQAQDAEHQMDPLNYTGTMADAKARVMAILDAQSRVKVISETEDYVYAEFRTGVMMFTDDVEFYFDDEAKVLHFRSASRLGYSDMGLNRRRMTEISTAFLGE